MRSPFDRLVAWAAMRLGYAPADQLDTALARLSAEQVAHAATRRAGANAHIEARAAKAELAEFKREFERYRDGLLSSRYGIRVIDREEFHDGESVTMALRPPANPL